MLKKILVGGFILIMVGAIVAGAFALFAPSAEACASEETGARGAGLGQGAQGGGQRRGAENSKAGTHSEGQGQALGNQGQGAGGQGQGQGQGQRQNPGQSDSGQAQGQGQGRDRALGSETQATPLEGEVIEGLVLAMDELVIETSSGTTVQVGLGPSFYRESQGFVLEVGANVRVSGYWEENEFKAAQVENLDTGQSIILRDASGRPMWAGQGRGKNRSS